MLASQSSGLSPSAQDTREEEAKYRRQITTYLNEWDFDQLEKAARDARTGKERLEGGIWKLIAFYDAVSNPPAGEKAMRADWTNHLETVKQWVKGKPESATARIALAESYVSYSWAARGNGYANSVGQTAWDIFNEQTQLAESALIEAARLKEKCPHWYSVMIEVALAQGWDKSQARELFEDSIAFEPLYYRYYREFANFLLPKWYGAPGETEALAREVAARIGGDEGDLLYFEIASMVICQCESDKPPMPDLSWAKIKRGYAALGQLYGISPQKMNRFALMAYVADDRAAAQSALAKIGNDWDPHVWDSSASFKAAQAWAATP